LCYGGKMRNSKIKISLIFAGVLVFLNIFAWQAVFYESRHRYLEVDFLDVGQGDAIFVETPKNQQILIDGGPTSAILKKLRKEMPFWDRTIDLVILTHPEKDHLFGLLEVLKRYKVNYILWTGVVRDTSEWEEWDRLIKKEGANIEIAKAGERIWLETSNPAIYIDIFNPTESLAGVKLDDSNDSSVVGRLVIGSQSFLLTGDISSKIEKTLTKEDVGSTILKIAHHGSKYSTSDEFLKAVLPEIAVIPVGQNDYGHPTPEVLARLNKFGIKVFNTLKDGDIKIFSDGENIKLTTKL